PGKMKRELQSKVRSTRQEVKNKRGTLSDYSGHTMRRSKDGAYRGLHTQRRTPVDPVREVFTVISFEITAEKCFSPQLE
ncbi:hypothetical protein Bbelb_005990, partial [Branchiostoma belcheri]